MKRFVSSAGRALIVAGILGAGAAFPASAQEMSAAADAVSPVIVDEKSEEERAIEAQAVVFADSLKIMQDEIVAAWPDGNLEAILQPRRDLARALGDRMEAFLKARVASLPAGPARDEEEAEAVRSAAQVRALPDMIQSVVTKGLRARDAAASQEPGSDAGALSADEVPAES